MLLGGLWHGASWNFVIWGGYHGTLLGLEKLAGRRLSEQHPRWWLYPFRVVLTFGLVTVGWVFFRAATFAESRYVIAQMFTRAAVPSPLPVAHWLSYLAGISLLIAVIGERWDFDIRLSRGPAWAYGAAIVILLFTVELLGVTGKSIPFVYFQF